MNRLPTAMISIALLAPTTHAQSWELWQPESTLPTDGAAKTHAIGFELNGTIFILGGPPWVNPDDMEDATVYSMPAGGGPWTDEPGFDGYGGILGQGGGVDNLGRIIIFGGDDPNNPGTIKPPFEWNQEEGPWRDHTDRSPSAPLTYFAFCNDSSNRIYSLGGGPGKSANSLNPNSSYCERFIGSTDVWEPIAPMPIPVAGAAASPDGLGHILVFGGIDELGTTRINTVQQYDLSTDTWSTTNNAQMPAALSDHQATLGSDGRIYIMGGTTGPLNGDAIESIVHVYDPMQNQWFAGPEMSVPRRHFASFLGSDDRIYVAGGESFTGGTNTVESFFTTPCPVIVTQPSQATQSWLGSTLNLSAQVLGGGTITYQWMHNDLPLTDGPSSGGGTITGSTTDTLAITLVDLANAGAYQLIATNSCGTVTTTTAFVALRTPPSIDNGWAWTSLHPPYATSSYAYGVDNGIQVGNAVFDTPDYNNIDHPFTWTGTAASATNLTPGGSQGGNIVDFAGDKLVGWWWAPISCYVNHQWQTCYYRRGAWWTLDGTFHETSYSGYEYTMMSATDGETIVGSGSTDDAVGNVFTRAVIWNQSSVPTYANSIHPTGYPDSSAAAVDGEYQFGTVSLPYQGLHAAMWNGTSTSFIDMHPEGYTNSAIVDASDGQQVGVVNRWSNPRAIIWNYSPDSIIDITPEGAASSSLSACESGLQIGTATFESGTVPGIWAGTSNTFTDLSQIIPEGYDGFFVNAIDVAEDGTVYLVGSSRNLALNRTEAILVTSINTPPCQADLNGDDMLDFLDISEFLSAYSANDPAADLNNDTMFDFLDISAFLTQYTQGCP